MRVVEKLKKACSRFSGLLNGTKDDSIALAVDDLREAYGDPKNKKIALIGGKAARPEEVVEEFEKEKFALIGKFLHIDFNGSEKKSKNASPSNPSSVDINDSLLAYINARTQPSKFEYVMPFLNIVIILFMAVLFSNREEFGNYLVKYFPKTWDLSDIILAITILCAIIIFLCFIGVINSAISLGILRKTKRIEFGKVSFKNEITATDTKELEIVTKLGAIRRQIGYTVVFKNMENFGERDPYKIVRHLCHINNLVNISIQKTKWHWAMPLKKPVRFLCIYSSDKNHLRSDEVGLFNRIIQIDPSVTIDTVFPKMRKAFEKETENSPEVLKDILNMLDSADYRYRTEVSQYLVDKERLERMIKEYIKEYKKLVSRTTPQKDDTYRLLSWIIYKEFFP